MTMKDLMADTETAGTRAGCGILSIGLVWFDPHARHVGGQFYAEIDRASCEAAGLWEDPETIAWHEKTQEGRALLYRCKHAGRDLTEVLHDADRFMMGTGTDFQFWSNGAAFDGPIIEAAMAAVGMKARWDFNQVMCYRTLKRLWRDVPYARAGVAHHALDDAMDQSGHVMDIFGRHEHSMRLVKP